MFPCTIFSGPLPEKLKIHLNKMSSSQEDNFIIKFPAITAQVQSTGLTVWKINHYKNKTYF